MQPETAHSRFGFVVTLLCAPPWHPKILVCLLAQWDRCLIDGRVAPGNRTPRLSQNCT